MKQILVALVRTPMRALYWTAAAIAAVVGGQSSDTIEMRDARWETKQGWTEVAGVCSMNSETVDCWDTKGKHDEKLTELIRAYYLVNEQTIPVRLGMKNRYIVTRSMTKEPNRGSFSAQWTHINGGYLNQCSGIYRQSSPGYTWYHVATDASVTKMDLMAQLNTPVEGLPDLEMKVGATAKIGDGELKVKSIGDLKPSPKVTTGGFGYSGPGFAPAPYKWSIQLTKTNIPADLQIYFAALDSKKIQVSQIDEKGNPIVADVNGMRNGRSYPNFNIVPKPDGLELMSQINVSKFDFLKINITHTEKAMARDIPLDPAH